MMKLLSLALVLLPLAACELQPAPPSARTGSASATGSAATPPSPAAEQAGSAAHGSAAPAAAPIAGGSAGSAATRPPAPPVDVTPECEQAGIKLAELMIAGAEASQKPAFERDRANIVRRTEVVCSQQHWVPAALACINQSKNDRDARACLEKFPAPAVKAAEAPAKGSAASPTTRGPSAPHVPATEQQTRGKGTPVHIPEPHRH
jgi:hypothetical protein